MANKIDIRLEQHSSEYEHPQFGKVKQDHPLKSIFCKFNDGPEDKIGYVYDETNDISLVVNFPDSIRAEVVAAIQAVLPTATAGNVSQVPSREAIAKSLETDELDELEEEAA